MFATRSQNENAIYDQQTAAAAKSLNAGGGVKGLAPKTPGQKAPPPKTPFKAPLNDENATLLGGKAGGGKAKDGGLFGGKATGGKAERNAFQTPAGPRTTNRAPLGNKTTNAKLRDPRSQQQQQKSHFKPLSTTKSNNNNNLTTPRLRRPKLSLPPKEGEAAHPLSDDVEREIEYMPPRPVPLPDDPTDCWPSDRTYPQFEGMNFCRGWTSEFDPPRDEDELSDFGEKVRQIEERERKEKFGLGTVKARHAARTLGSTGRVHVAENKARVPFTEEKKSLHGGSMAGNSRHTAAKVASKTTLGYSQGRRTVSGMKKHGAAGSSAGGTAVRGGKESAGENVALNKLFKLSRSVEEEEDEALKGCVGFEDELEGFQLAEI